MDYLTTDTELTSIADAIRTKGGTSASLVYPAGFISAINAISGGLEYEEGIWTPTADISCHPSWPNSAPTIYFTNTHTAAPSAVILAYIDSNSQTLSANSVLLWASISFRELLNGDTPIERSSGTAVPNGLLIQLYQADTAQVSNGIEYYSFAHLGNGYLYNDRFQIEGDSRSKYYRANKNYKWFAIWK